MLRESQPHSIELVRVNSSSCLSLYISGKLFSHSLSLICGQLIFSLPQRLELHTKSLSESRLEDTARIQMMEKELLNCYKEIGKVYLSQAI